MNHEGANWKMKHRKGRSQPQILASELSIVMTLSFMIQIDRANEGLFPLTLNIRKGPILEFKGRSLYVVCAFMCEIHTETDIQWIVLIHRSQGLILHVMSLTPYRLLLTARHR